MKDNPAQTSYSSSVLTRRAVDFSIIFFPAGERIAGSPVSQQAQQVASSPWSPSCSAPDLHRRVASFPPLSSGVALQLHRRFRNSWASIPAMHSPSANSSSEWTQQAVEMLRSLCFTIHWLTVSFLWELWSLFVQEIVQMSCRTSVLKEKHRKSFSRRKAVRVTRPTQQQSCPSSTATQFSTRMGLTEKQELSMYREQSTNTHTYLSNF